MYSVERISTIKIRGGASTEQINSIGSASADFAQENNPDSINIEDLDPETLKDNHTPLHDMELPDITDPYTFNSSGDNVSIGQDYETGEIFVSREYESPENTPTEAFDSLVKDTNITDKYPELQSEEKLNELKNNFVQSYHNVFKETLDKQEKQLNNSQEDQKRSYYLKPLHPDDPNSVDCVSTIISSEDDEDIVLGGAIGKTHNNASTAFVVNGSQIFNHEVEKMFEDD